jgi:hypothetical protein
MPAIDFTSMSVRDIREKHGIIHPSLQMSELLRYVLAETMSMLRESQEDPAMQAHAMNIIRLVDKMATVYADPNGIKNEKSWKEFLGDYIVSAPSGLTVTDNNAGQ